MTALRFSSFGRLAIAFLALASLSCSTDDLTKAPTLTTVTVTLPSSTIVTGQTVTATTAGTDQHGAVISVGTVTWSTSAAGVATVNSSGVVTGVSAGTAQIIATSDGKTGQQTITVTAPAGIKINEIESNGGTPGDWVELYNPTTASVDISGWVLKDNDDTHSYTFPSGSVITAGGYLVAEEASFGFGLGAADAARLFNQFSVPVDSYTWTVHATTTYGRCSNGTGDFTTTNSSTKGAVNDCGVTSPVTSTWPGPGTDVQTVDGMTVFGGNLSGLTYEAANGSTPAVLWAARNGPGTLFRLVWNGTIWTPEAANGWDTGKALHYTDGLGNPDAEGVTFAGSSTTGGMYVSTERNNDASTVSRLSILRFDPTQSGTSLTATNDWNLTSDIPVVGANLGLEAITWIPDTYLVSKGFYDEAAGHVYTPSTYTDHGTGLFFVGVEANGMLYAYALNHTTNGFTRVATIASGYTAIMDLNFDHDTGYLWAECDDGCGGLTSTLEINTTSSSPNFGRFQVTRVFARPSSMPNINNEGFTIAPESECVGGFKYAYWADDSETSGHSIRRATMACGLLP